MADLSGNRRPFGMHSLSQFPQSGQHLGMPQDLATVCPPLGRDGAMSHRGHADTTRRMADMELSEFAGDQAPAAQPFVGSGLDDAVTQGHRAQLRWSEYVRHIVGCLGQGIPPGRAPRSGETRCRR